MDIVYSIDPWHCQFVTPSCIKNEPDSMVYSFSIMFVDLHTSIVNMGDKIRDKRYVTIVLSLKCFGTHFMFYIRTIGNLFPHGFIDNRRTIATLAGLVVYRFVF